MYQLNDIVVYESSGVCRICDIQELSFSEDTAPNTYYILAPLFSPGDVIYTPVNSTKTVFRPVISREEALETLLVKTQYSLTNSMKELDKLMIASIDTKMIPLELVESLVAKTLE